MASSEKQSFEQLSLLEEGPPYRVGQPAQTAESRPRKVASPSIRRDRKTIQDLLLPEGLMAVRLSVELNTLEEMHVKLQEQLSQNSTETRRRYSQLILSWFFWDGIDGLARQTWQSYGEERIEVSILRYLYLVAEPLVGNCVSHCLFPLEEGMMIPAPYFERYLRDDLGGEPPMNTLKRLKTNLAKLGFLERSSTEGDHLKSISVDKTAFLVVLHSIFSPARTRTVALTHILQNPFWKYLGLKSEQSVRAILREADLAGLLSKYIAADQLEQVTTSFSLTELLKRKVRL